MPPTDDEVEARTGVETDDADGEVLSDDDAKTLLKQAKTHFKQARESCRDDFEMAGQVQNFIGGDQWPQGIKQERLALDRPCLTLDHLGQYCRHVINTSLMRKVDPRVLPMDGEGDDRVAEVLAGMIRQITQLSTSRVAYETGLRHAVHVGFGYWRVKAVPVTGATEGQLELTIRRIADPRMVLFDPFCDYPDGRDAQYCFVLTKLTHEEFERQYGEGDDDDTNSDSLSTWAAFDGTTAVWPYLGSAESKEVVVAEYYYRDENGALKWCICTPDKILDHGDHLGDLIPILRVVGEEFEVEGKTRRRGMVEPAMDAARAYNYSASAFIENVALAPIAPFVAAAGQVEQYQAEWKDAHRVPRATLRYNPVNISGQLVPAPERSAPPGIPSGWQGMMQNLIGDMQMIMGLGQPSVIGTGTGAIQSGSGLAEQKAPGEVNTYHFHEHWMCAIEQTGRVILAMIPYVYLTPQAVKIVGADGNLTSVVIDPTQPNAVTDAEPVPPVQQTQQGQEQLAAVEKLLSPVYNPSIGRYDVQIVVGPSSASKKAEANKMLMTMVNAQPQMLPLIGDLIIGTMDLPNADVIAKRMKQMQGVDPAELQQKMQMHELQIGKLKEENQALQQMLLGEQQKAAASLQKAELDNQTKLSQAQLDAEVQLEIAVRGNINAILIERMKSQTKIEATVITALAKADAEKDRAARMSGYSDVTSQLAQ